MASSQDQLKQRVTHDADPTTTTTTNTTAMNDNKNRGTKRDNKKMAMAKRGLRSLIIAVSFPLSFTLLSSYIGSTMSRDHEALNSKKPFWFPPSWALHLTCPASGFLMGLSAWMVWAEGGFHRYPMALVLYLAQLLLTVIWDPVVFGAGATRFGMLVCLGLFGSLIWCVRLFKQVNPIAGDLIKPCLAWTAFLSLVNLQLLFV